jgi:hypothetical protein
VTSTVSASARVTQNRFSAAENTFPLRKIRFSREKFVLAPKSVFLFRKLRFRSGKCFFANENAFQSRKTFFAPESRSLKSLSTLPILVACLGEPVIRCATGRFLLCG